MIYAGTDSALIKALDRHAQPLEGKPRDFDVLIDAARADKDAADLLAEPRLQRAIGVIYRPGTERQSHYYRATLPRQFDLLLHYDTTSAVLPLDSNPEPQHAELDETYPSGL